MTKVSKACDISPSVRKEVIERDGGCCIICGRIPIQIAHYIGRGRLGLGVPRNLACLCINCHFRLDNGKYPQPIRDAFKEYLLSKYDDWNEKDIVYRKE